MPSISIPDDTYQALLAQAVARGTTVEALATPALQSVAHGTAASLPLTAEEWVADWQAWTNTLPKRAVTLDDSRESIYEDRL